MGREVAVFHLYRQRLPAAAPQAMQILSTCHALALAGARVSLRVDPPLRGEQGSLAAVLEDYGLEPHPRLEIDWLSRYRPWAGIQFRAALGGWLRRARSADAMPVVFSRRVDYAARWLRLRRRLGLPFVLVHEWHYVASANALEAGEEARARSLAYEEAEVLAGADAHVAVSSALKRYLESHHAPDGPVVVIPNGGPEVTAVGVGPAVRGGEPGRPRVVYAGLFRRPADLELLIEAARRLPPALELVVLGGDEEGQRLEAVRARVRAAGLEGRLSLPGPVSARVVREELSRASVAVATFASSFNMTHFACPLKILEYQAAAVPLVASDFPTVRELVRDSETGLLVPPEDPGRLAAAIVRLIEDGGLAGRLAAGARLEAVGRTWRRRGERLLELFRALEARSGVLAQPR